MRTIQVPVRGITRVRQSQREAGESKLYERLQTLGRRVVQEHLEAFNRLADK